MEKRECKAVIFDLDGTLSDSLASIQKAANLAIGKYGFAPYGREQYRYFVGDGADELIRRCLVNGKDKTLSYFERVREEYRRTFAEYCMYQVRPYEGIRELLTALKERGKRLAVLSNKPHEQTLDVIHTLFGEECFDCVQGQAEGIARKPSPEGVHFICRRLDIAPSDVIYVGDTNTDMKTGKSAGAYTIGVLWGFRDREELEENQADAIIERPCELLNYTG